MTQKYAYSELILAATLTTAMTPLIQQNARDLEEELAWFARVLDTRLKLYFDQPSEVDDVFAITPPDLRASDAPYARFVLG